ncbi:MAG: transglutaminase family protein [Methanomassiliicoccus sp.]|nr:transglutaminase family protein [Methanomassiliicoccus sp.]
MKGAGIFAAVALTVVILIGASYYALVVVDDTGSSVGFQHGDLVKPTAPLAPTSNLSLIGNMSLVPISAENINLFWNITEDIYAGYGGALQLRIENMNPGTLYVYSFGLKWAESGQTYMRNCSVAIVSGDTRDVGLLLFGAPSAGTAKYQIIVKAAVSNRAGTTWYDAGTMPSSSNTATIDPLTYARDQNVELNVKDYYNRVNERIDTKVVASLAQSIEDAYPGGYSTLQIARAYEWVKDNIAYISDTSTDYWQTASETLSRGTGDCEDHAILLCSMISALGGTSRVNIIQEHAFPTVYIGSTAGDLLKAKQSLASFYGLETSEYRMTYLTDASGYWLVIDTTGFPYAGGLPAKSEPTTADGNWTMLSSYLVSIDVTGKTISGGVLGSL